MVRRNTWVPAGFDGNLLEKCLQTSRFLQPIRGLRREVPEVTRLDLTRSPSYPKLFLAAQLLAVITNSVDSASLCYLLRSSRLEQWNTSLYALEC